MSKRTAAVVDLLSSEPGPSTQLQTHAVTQRKRRQLDWRTSLERVVCSNAKLDAFKADDSAQVETLVRRAVKDKQQQGRVDWAKVLKTIGLLACVAHGTPRPAASTSTSTEPQPSQQPQQLQQSQPLCSACDALALPSASTSPPPPAPAAAPPAPQPARPTTTSDKTLVPFVRAGVDVFLPAKGEYGAVSRELRLAWLRSLRRLITHASTRCKFVALDEDAALLDALVNVGLARGSRAERLAAGQALASLLGRFVARSEDDDGEEDESERQNNIDDEENNHGTSAYVNGLEYVFSVIDDALASPAPSVRETLLVTLGLIAQQVALPHSRLERLVLVRLVARLGASNTYLAALARTQLAHIALARHCKPFALVQPHFAHVMPAVVRAMAKSPATLAAASQALNLARDAVLDITATYCLPELIVDDDQTVLQHFEQALKSKTADLLLEEPTGAAVLKHILALGDQERAERALHLFNKYIQETDLHLDHLYESVKVSLIFNIVLDLGDISPFVQAGAERALSRVWVKYVKDVPKDAVDKGVHALLERNFTGVLAHMNAALREPESHRPALDKRKVVRALAKVGVHKIRTAVASSYLPQVMATLLTTLGENVRVRAACLDALLAFVRTLKSSQLAPFIATLSATVVRLWPELARSTRQRYLSITLVQEIVDQHGDSLSRSSSSATPAAFTFADLSAIPELKKLYERLSRARPKQPLATRLTELAARCASENAVVSIQALEELRAAMRANADDLALFSSGDSFAPVIGSLVKTLFAVITRDASASSEGTAGETDASRLLRNAAFECLGILGAVDPDRTEIAPSDVPQVVFAHFEDPKESRSFAVRLIESLLIDAYQDSSDTRHQQCLGFVIQELLRFCNVSQTAFDARDTKASNDDTSTVVVDDSGKVTVRPSQKILDTCGSLLASQFMMKDRKDDAGTLAYPLYKSQTSYRAWLLTWTRNLIANVPDDGSDVARIFRPFAPVLRIHDAAVARALLPHLVLHALAVGSSALRENVHKEIEAVLNDVVDPGVQMLEASRQLCAQTVFHLMDHLSRWLRRARQLRGRRKRGSTKSSASNSLAQSQLKQRQEEDDQRLWQVDQAIQRIPQLLVAQAAFNARSYARCLSSFEAFITTERQTRSELELQTFYERVHECYAHLEEPDGMEGISTRIVAPDIWHQIREHESTGRWTSAQSCWEVELQRSPNEVKSHLGLLRCLRNLGHYDSMRTHILGLLYARPNDGELKRQLAPYEIEASLFVKDWAAVQDVLRLPDIAGAEVDFGRVIMAMRQGDPTQLSTALARARESLGSPIVTAAKESYRRAYDEVVNLHVLDEIDLIYQSAQEVATLKSLAESRLASRIAATSPSFRVREPILNMRRIALSAVEHSSALSPVAGELWSETATIARKAGHFQTSYSALLHARALSAPVFLQSAKLSYANGQVNQAIHELEYALDTKPPSYPSAKSPSRYAKAALLQARWLSETGRLDSQHVKAKFTSAIELAPNWENAHYHLGHHYDQMYQHDLASNRARQEDYMLGLLRSICQSYSEALRYGTKYIYQALPRMLTIWLDMAENKDLIAFCTQKTGDPPQKIVNLNRVFTEINTLMRKNVQKLPTFEFLTVLPQLVSRICHPNKVLAAVLERTLEQTAVRFPDQAFWALASGTQASATKRKRKCARILAAAKAEMLRPKPGRATKAPTIFEEGGLLVRELLGLCSHNPPSRVSQLSMHQSFPTLQRAWPAELALPLQSSMTPTLPSDAATLHEHNPFPTAPVRFQRFLDQIDVMSSLVKPKKISLLGDNGKTYAFLCKPKDDLRKDARLMEFNSMINKLLKKESAARNRSLHIRTYAVVPLSEDSGLIEWVPNVVVLRNVLNSIYQARSIQTWSAQLKNFFDRIRSYSDDKAGEAFEKECMPQFPSVFHEWFLETFPEPSAWFRARLGYSRTAAVISIVGFVLGLGDRHCENILLDSVTGDTVHVDFNCLFDKGHTFEFPEKVPFRLTHNIVDGMGITGVEGTYRRAAEITLQILRDNRDSLMSVLETFVHDPLMEWSQQQSRKSRRDISEDSPSIAAEVARKQLDPVLAKLKGLQVTHDPRSRGEVEVSVGEQVERLIREARNNNNLAVMYVGWCPWF